jgi:hypothetical protein
VRVCRCLSSRGRNRRAPANQVQTRDGYEMQTVIIGHEIRAVLGRDGQGRVPSTGRYKDGRACRASPAGGWPGYWLAELAPSRADTPARFTRRPAVLPGCHLRTAP